MTNGGKCSVSYDWKKKISKHDLSILFSKFAHSL